MMSEYNTSDLIIHAAENKALEFNAVFEDILKDKLFEAVENKKVELSISQFNEDWREKLSALAAHNTNLPITRKEAEERRDKHSELAKSSNRGTDRVTHLNFAKKFDHVIKTMDKNEGNEVDGSYTHQTPESVSTLVKASDKHLKEENLESDWGSVDPYIKDEKQTPPKPKKKPKLNIPKNNKIIIHLPVNMATIKEIK